MKDKGFTLIEVLISLLILALGFIWLSSMQVQNIRSNQSAMMRSQAVMLANSMIESMRANEAVALSGDYDLGTPGDPDIKVCDVPEITNLITDDQSNWMTALKDSMGDADTTCGLINCSSTECRVKVFWDDRKAGGEIDEMVEVTSKL